MFGNLIKRSITSSVLIIILCLGLFYNENSWKILVIILSLLCFFEFYNLLDKAYNNKVIKLNLNILIALYLYFLYFLLIRIRLEHGEEIVLIFFVTCFCSDIGGYVFGKLVGGPKLTKISPNKTISGSIGSIIFTIIGSSLFALFFLKTDKYLVSFENYFTIFIWLIMMSVFCQIGDLLVSYLKRKAKVKDTGNILPGHGGILDRVDGIIFAIPFGFFTYHILISGYSL